MLIGLRLCMLTNDSQELLFGIDKTFIKELHMSLRKAKMEAQTNKQKHLDRNGERQID